MVQGLIPEEKELILRWKDIYRQMSKDIAILRTEENREKIIKLRKLIKEKKPELIKLIKSYPKKEFVGKAQEKRINELIFLLGKIKVTHRVNILDLKIITRDMQGIIYAIEAKNRLLESLKNRVPKISRPVRKSIVYAMILLQFLFSVGVKPLKAEDIIKKLFQTYKQEVVKGIINKDITPLKLEEYGIKIETPMKVTKEMKVFIHKFVKDNRKNNPTWKGFWPKRSEEERIARLILKAITEKSRVYDMFGDQLKTLEGVYGKGKIKEMLGEDYIEIKDSLNIEYETPGLSGPKSAKRRTYTAEEVFKNRKGDCNEQSYLYIAFCRERGLRAELVYVETGKNEKHACAAVEINGKYILVDPASKVFGATFPQYRIIESPIEALFIHYGDIIADYEKYLEEKIISQEDIELTLALSIINSLTKNTAIINPSFAYGKYFTQGQVRAIFDVALEVLKEQMKVEKDIEKRKEIALQMFDLCGPYIRFLVSINEPTEQVSKMMEDATNELSSRVIGMNP